MKLRTYCFFSLLCSFALTLTSCGFHLASKVQVPQDLHKLYVYSSSPYGQLTRNIKQALAMRDVTLVNNQRSALFSLNISTSDLSESQTSQGTAQLTREFTLSLSATFTLVNNLNHRTVRSVTLSSSQSITVPAGQLLSNSNQAQEVSATLQREITEQFFFFLSSEETRSAINSSIKTYKASHKTSTPIEKTASTQ